MNDLTSHQKELLLSLAPVFAKAELVAGETYPSSDVIEIQCLGDCVVYSSIYESEVTPMEHKDNENI